MRSLIVVFRYAYIVIVGGFVKFGTLSRRNRLHIDTVVAFVATLEGIKKEGGSLKFNPANKMLTKKQHDAVIDEMGDVRDISIPQILTICFKDVISTENGNVSATCLTCSKVLKGSVVATTNFLKHLKTKGHAEALKNYEALKVPVKRRKDNETENPTSKLKQFKLQIPDAGENDNLDTLILKFVIETMSPLSIVEYSSFQNLVHGANKTSKPVQILGRHSLTQKLDREYEKIKMKIIESLIFADYVCTTADVWSSSKRSYLGMTAHWIDKVSLERKSASLACKRFKGIDTFDRVAKMMTEIHSDFNLKLNKITKTITDNGSNMVKAFEVFGQDENVKQSTSPTCEDNDDDVEDDDGFFPRDFPNVDEDSYGFDYEFPPHERCATHTLHLVAAVDTKDIEISSYKKIRNAALGKCQAFWNNCSKSPKACALFFEITGKSVSLPCATRWNSYNNAIIDMLAVQEKINDAMKALNLTTFKDADLAFLKEYSICLKPFADAIQSLQGEEQTYYGVLLPELQRINKMLISLRLENLVYCRTLSEKLEESLIKRFHRFFILDSSANDAICATVSHPFFKMKWAPKEQKDRVRSVFLLHIRKLKESSKKSDVNLQIGDNSFVKEEYYFSFQDNEDSSDSFAATEGTPDLEALQYLQDKRTNFEMLHDYPTVRRMFIKCNTCLPSSAPVERLFSFGGMIMRPHRKEMTDDVFEKLILLKSNYG